MIENIKRNDFDSDGEKILFSSLRLLESTEKSHIFKH